MEYVRKGFRRVKNRIVNRLDCPYDFTRAQKKAYREATKIVDWVYGENREKYFDRIKAIYDRYFVPSDEAAAFVDARFRELIAPGERTLGLLCRGTDSPSAAWTTRESAACKRRVKPFYTFF